MKVIRLSTSKKGYGGIIYEKMVDDVLKEQFDYQVESAAFTLRGKMRLLEAPLYLWRQRRFAKKSGALLIRSFQSALFNYKHKGLTIIYHIDSSGSPFLPKLFQDIAELIFKLVIKKSEHIVVIADYWKRYFENRGYSNVHLVYCGYELEQYDCSSEEMDQFRVRYGLEGKKIIYIGNPQVKKGAAIAYEALKNSGYTLVTSGVRDQVLDCLHLDLGFKDYLCLLKASEVVVLMSQFAEGWNRIAHEAMLMGTPVIGTGYGGMGEVLEGGGQEVCRVPAELKSLVAKVLMDREAYVKRGFEYSRQFGMERFRADWVSLVRKLGAN